MRRWLKRLLIGLITLIIAIPLVIALLYLVIIQRPNYKEFVNFEALPENTWVQVDLDNTLCSDGSSYRMYTRRGTSDNLLIHFVGGGMAWDATSAAEPITPTDISGYYFPYIWEIVRVIAGGVFQQDNAQNPFADWTVVYIPYCTADFHIGAASPVYVRADGSSQTIYHYGQQNVRAALDWIFRTFDTAPKILVSGESAGGFGSIFWAPHIAQHYAESDVYQLADGAYLATEKWQTIVNDVWQANAEQNFQLEIGADLAGDAYRQRADDELTNITYLHINTVYDEVLLRFNAILEDKPNDAAYQATWSQAMRASMQATSDSGLPYYYFLTDATLDAKTGTTKHTSISSPLFYEIEEDNVFLHDWLRRVVIEGERFSVGAALVGE